jgi:acyl-coenzyme A thioesterase PaaI-like protein
MVKKSSGRENDAFAPSGQLDGLARIAAQIRTVGNAFLTGDYAEFCAATGALAAAGKYAPRRAWRQNVPNFARGPISGRFNPIAPWFRFEIGGRGVIGTGRLLNVHEGPPNLAHGGITAALLDDALGRVVLESGRESRTARLTVNYRHGVPLFTILVVEAWIDHEEGRKLFTQAQISAEGKCLAEASGLMIIPRTVHVPPLIADS